MFRAAILALVFLMGCTKPSGYVDFDADRHDERESARTSYKVVETDDGFYLLVNYDLYQFVPDREAIREACRQRVIDVANHVSERSGRKIESIDLYDVRPDAGVGSFRGLTGVTTCHAEHKVRWAGE